VSNAHHTPLAFGGPLTSAAMESPLGQLDAAIVAVGPLWLAEAAARLAQDNLILSSVGSGGWASTLDATASSGQKVVPVVSTTGAVAGMPVYIGLTSGTHEVGVIDTISAGVSVTLVANLASTYAAPMPISATPAEVADARGGYATLGERLRLASFATQFAADSARAAARARIADVPPGYVVTGPSAASATTAISGGVDVAPTDSGTFAIDTTHFRYSLATPVNIQPNWPRNFVKGTGLDSTYAVPPIGMEFDYSGSQLEFQVRGDGAGTIYVVSAGDRPVATLSPGLPSDGSNYRYLVTFPDARLRTIRIEGSGALGPITRQSTATVALPESRSGPRVIVLGDSWTEGTGSGSVLLGYARQLGTIMGWRDIWSSGSGGTGYLADGVTTPPRKTFRARSATDVIAPAPNVVIVAGGINDTAFTGAQVGAEATLLYAALVAGLPDVQIIVIGPWWPKAASTITNQVEANRVAIRAAAIAAGLYFIDPVAEGWITGTGHVGATTGDGNADVFISADGAHPSAAGHQYLAERLAGHLLTIGATR
jgi:lysophospholipase L1-like esterase